MAESKPSEVVALEEDDDDDANLPDANTCQKLVEEFASVTTTDEALAQFFLQDHNWNLESSLNAFYESRGNEEGANQALVDADVIMTFNSQSATNGPALSRNPLSTFVTTKPPTSFKLLTWNVDGLDEHNLKKRTKAVAKVIEEEKPDVVFLQEMIPVTYSYLEDHLPHYTFIGAGTDDYFTATLVRRTTVYFDGHVVHPFPESRMGRNLLLVDCHIGSLKLRLLNSHLESTQEFSGERKSQLRTALNLLTAGSKDHTSIFGGDLNLRDKEAKEVCIPSNVFDLWESCGERPECKYTWDTVRNTNKSFPGKFKPRLRFDRVYLHQSTPPSIHPTHFGLVGIQKVANTQSFPSDHWGVVVCFDILNQRAHTSSPPPSHNNLNIISQPSTTTSFASKEVIPCLDVSDEVTEVVQTFHRGRTEQEPVVEVENEVTPDGELKRKRCPSIVELD